MALSSRRQFIHYTAASHSPLFSAAGDSSSTTSTFNSNVIMIVAALVTAFICALALNTIVRCLFRLTIHSRPSIPTVLPRAAAASRRAIRKLPVEFYSPGLKLVGSGSECAICLSVIEPGEQIRLLPNCCHIFHVCCIDPWLLTRPTCPNCRVCLFATSRESSGCGEPEEVGRTGIEPLEPEGFEFGYRL
ncbi:RING-H2 finger protein ATL74-like [Phalaenopsis equestris]|uniref:RING-H2 finger protein ATL74-like n=1 Tax=Phalaenopsis equestris TaxID=78828 RepID=UPI0009E24851|nr:RING-H2 finger protein ATL74-like [Phalaenopsis equestris]